MGFGAYRHRVTLEHPAGPISPAVWDCAIQPQGSQMVEGLATHWVRGRYHPGITNETRLLFEGRTLFVQSVTDVDERHLDLVLVCQEIVAGGGEPVTH
jgi:Phage head-tail joining protein